MTEQRLTSEREAEIRARVTRRIPGRPLYDRQMAIDVLAELDALRAERDQLRHTVDWLRRENEGRTTALKVAYDKRDRWKRKAEWLAARLSCAKMRPDTLIVNASGTLAEAAREERGSDAADRDC